MPVPPCVCLDTSFVVEALLTSQPLHESCARYLARLAEASADLLVSRLLELELREATFQIALKERHPRDWKRFRGDGRARPRAARLTADITSAWDAVLENFVWTEVEIVDVMSSVAGFMEHGLASYDAVHAATAATSDPPRVVTIDAGFAAVPESELKLYVDSSRLQSCRSRRS